ncbi:MAG: flippase-like domain-containing protein [Chloroflexi bacterium]|nr:flippase-like domain-containing protein [Chloroflexota bacterium]
MTVLMLALAGLASRTLDWGRVLEAGLRATAFHWLGAFLLLMAAGYLRALRWRLLFGTRAISTLRLFRVQNEGIGLNNLLPLGVASEATQWLILTQRDRVDGSFTLATLGMERIMGLASSLVVMALGFALYSGKNFFPIYGLIAFVLAVGILLVPLTLSAVGAHLPKVRDIPFVHSLVVSIHTLHNAWDRLVLSFLVSLIYWLVVGAAVAVLASALEIGLSLAAITLVITGAITFVTTVPVSPAAVGTFELATVYGLSLFGVGSDAALGLAILAHLLFFVPPTLIAIALLPQEGIGSLSQVKKLSVTFPSLVRPQPTRESRSSKQDKQRPQ